MNLRQLDPSRKQQQAGDVFAMQLPDGRFLFGRVINTDASAFLQMGGALLLYFYRHISATMDMPNRSLLTPDQLLFAPVMTNRQAWFKGYFLTLANVPLEAGDTLPTHCFHWINGKYHDENGLELPERVEPCGEKGLHSFRTIDDLVSETLGFPLSEDDA